jgi:hypothetical protein
MSEGYLHLTITRGSRTRQCGADNFSTLPLISISGSSLAFDVTDQIFLTVLPLRAVCVSKKDLNASLRGLSSSSPKNTDGVTDCALIEFPPHIRELKFATTDDLPIIRRELECLATIQSLADLDPILELKGLQHLLLTIQAIYIQHADQKWDLDTRYKNRMG